MLSSGLAHAEDIILPQPPPLQLDEPSVGKAISPLKLGQRAPFTGILFSPDATISITTELKTSKEQTKLEVDKAVKLCLAENKYELDIAQIELLSTKEIADTKHTSLVLQNDVLVKRIKTLEDSYVNPVWYITGGVLGGILSSALIVSLAK